MNCAEEAEKAAMYDEAWQALPAWVTDACEPDHCGDLPHAIGLLREKAALWDALAARLDPSSASWAESWDVYQGTHGRVIIQTSMRTFVEADTLADAVQKAMEAEKYENSWKGSDGTER